MYMQYTVLYMFDLPKLQTLQMWHVVKPFVVAVKCPSLHVAHTVDFVALQTSFTYCPVIKKIIKCQIQI